MTSPDISWLLEQLADYTTDTILVTEAYPFDGPDGPRIVYCNAGFERMTGWSLSEIIGKTPRFLQVDDRDRKGRNAINAALTAWQKGDRDARAHVELYNRKRNDETFWVDVNLVPIWNSTLKKSYWASIQREITGKKEDEKTLMAALEQAAMARDSQEQFLATVNHELRTPLTAILGSAEALDLGVAGSITTKQQEHTASIIRAGTHLSGMIGDLLDTISARTETMNVDIGMTPIAEIVNFVANGIEAKARRACVTIDIDIGKSIDRHVLCDRTRARQCLLNIVDNAVKASPAENRVRIFAEDVDNFLLIGVEDNGPGMHEDDIDLAFSMFGKIHPSSWVSNDGLGLGLPLTAQLMEKQGGRIDVVTRPGEGTTMHLFFPTDTARLRA